MQINEKDFDGKKYLEEVVMSKTLCRKTTVHGWNAAVHLPGHVLAAFGQRLSPALSVSFHLLSCRCQALTVKSLI